MSFNEPTTDTTDETTPARFMIFQQADSGWVLRDYLADRDYPFITRAGAIAGMKLRATTLAGYLLGSPIELNQYGEVPESHEVFA